MSLPPVVSDPVCCPKRISGTGDYPPHDWEKVAGHRHGRRGVPAHTRCRYCGGRKPDD